MHTAIVPTRRFTGLDYRVWMVMLVTWTVCLGWYGYNKLRNGTEGIQPCAANVSLTVNNKEETMAVCYLDRIAIFQIKAPKGARVEWRFDDGTPAAYGTIVQHKYAAEGDYTVTVRLNGECKYTQDLTVKEAPVSTTEERTVQIIPDSTAPKTGSTVRFYAVCDPPAESYEWRLLETGEVQHEAVASFTFAAAGKYKVQVVLNSDAAHPKTKTIEVTDLPPAPAVTYPFNANGGGNPVVPGPLLNPGDNPFADVQKGPANNPANGGTQPEPPKTEPAKPKATNVDPETFKNKLQDVLNGDEEMAALYPYLDYQESTMVKIDGEKANITLKAFCKKYGKEKIETLEFKKDDKNGTWLLVKLEKRGFFKKLFGKK